MCCFHFSIIFLVCLNLSQPVNCSQIDESLLGLRSLELKVQKELVTLNIPSKSWIQHDENDAEDVLDVAIIGGGIGGLAAALALIREGIEHIQVFDENPEGFEGPWNSYARMNVLRSGKTCLGPALGIPSLTFWSWYEAQYGEEAWLTLKSVPTNLWNAYLLWFRHVLRLPVVNQMNLVCLVPLEKGFQLEFVNGSKQICKKARKVILATGRRGAGDFEIPQFINGISKSHYAHTGEMIDPLIYKNRKIVIIGAGASAFDVAATALEGGANSVTMIIRRNAVPHINKLNQLYYPGVAQGFYYLPDEDHVEYFSEALKYGTPPPKEALERVRGYENFYIHYSEEIQDIKEKEDGIIVMTNNRTIGADFILLATGYCVDLSLRKEMKAIWNSVLLWKDKITEKELQGNLKLGKFPYLGPHFELLENEQGSAPYLKDIYYFNYGAFLSHGMLSGDISLIGLGANRVVEGIVRDFFLSERSLYRDKYKKYKVPAYKATDYLDVLKNN